MIDCAVALIFQEVGDRGLGEQLHCHPSPCLRVTIIVGVSASNVIETYCTGSKALPSMLLELLEPALSLCSQPLCSFWLQQRRYKLLERSTFGAPLWEFQLFPRVSADVAVYLETTVDALADGVLGGAACQCCVALTRLGACNESMHG